MVGPPSLSFAFGEEKEAVMNQPSSSRPAQKSGCIALILRTFWLMAGNVVLGIIVIHIIMNRMPPFSIYDLVFGGMVILMIAVRYVDIAYFDGADSYGDPATIQHWRRYAVWLVVISLVVWSFAHGLVYYFAGRQ